MVFSARFDFFPRGSFQRVFSARAQIGLGWKLRILLGLIVHQTKQNQQSDLIYFTKFPKKETNDPILKSLAMKTPYTPRMTGYMFLQMALCWLVGSLQVPASFVNLPQSIVLLEGTGLLSTLRYGSAHSLFLTPLPLSVFVLLSDCKAASSPGYFFL